MSARNSCDFSSLDHYITKQISQNFLCGAVLLIGKNNQILHEEAYGYAQKYKLIFPSTLKSADSYLQKINLYKSLLNNPAPVTTEHLFDLASLTKVLATTFAMMLLVDQDRINLDDPIKKYLPEFNQSDKKSMTIRHLLSHSSGLKAWKPLYYHLTQPNQVIKFISGLSLEYPIDAERQYSDLGFMILRYMIEKITGQAFDEFLQQHLYKKLGLKNTVFNPSQHHPIASTSHGNPYEYKMIADHQFGYACDEDINHFHAWRDYTLTGEVNDANAHHVFAGVSSHAGLFSTAREVYTLLQLMLNHGGYQHQQLFKSQTIIEFTRKNKHGHGLGWMRSHPQSTPHLPLGKLSNHPFFAEALGHTGFTGTYIAILPTSDMTIVLLTNTQNLGVNSEGGYQNLHPFYGEVMKLIMNVFHPFNSLP